MNSLKLPKPQLQNRFQVRFVGNRHNYSYNILSTQLIQIPSMPMCAEPFEITFRGDEQGLVYEALIAMQREGSLTVTLSSIPLDDDKPTATITFQNVMHKVVSHGPYDNASTEQVNVVVMFYPAGYEIQKIQ